jgi:poly-gamma-glutamate capsule biosynthesis protein CapA/YwtB (metallophosphatase superfamily)/acylphosphatase
MLSTKKRLTAAGITCFGVGADQKEAARPLKLPLKGNYGDKNIYILNGMRASKRYWEKYSFFAGTDSPGVNSLNERRIERSIARIRKKDPESIIIICPHWQGLDYKWANDRLVQICRGFIDKGADFVIGHGPHMMQQIEQYRSGLIVYSLGNFVFNTGGEYKKRGVPPYSFIARLEIKEKREKWSTNYKLYPILSDNRRQGFRPRPVTRDEVNDAYAHIATHSPDRDKFIEGFNLARDRRGWHLYQHKSEVKQNFSSRLDEMSRRETRSKCRVERGGGKMIKKAKRTLKYYYYKTVCQLFGKNDSVSRNWFAQLLPGNSAVLLKVKGKVSGAGYNRWLKRNARINGVTCWVKKRGVKAVDILLIGPVEKLMVVSMAVREGPAKTKLNIMNERWLNKQGSLLVEDAPKKNDKVFTITFAGDTSFGDYFLKKLGDKKLIDRLENNPGSFYEGLRFLTDKASDHFIINLETVFADNPKSSLKGKKYPNWDNPQRTIPVLKNLGVTAVSLANNHTMDFGKEAMEKTCEQLEEAGIKYFGAGPNLDKASEPLKLKLRGEKSTKYVYIYSAMLVSSRYSKRYRDDYGFFAGDATPGVNPLNLDEIISSIVNLKRNEPDALVIVCPHWQGYDYKWVSPAIVDICRSLVTAGADYVLAHGISKPIGPIFPIEHPCIFRAT